jgi:hypothetical protein
MPSVCCRDPGLTGSCGAGIVARCQARQPSGQRRTSGSDAAPVPLTSFHGVVEKYEAEYPVFIVGDSPESLALTVTVDERGFAGLGNLADDSIETNTR